MVLRLRNLVNQEVKHQLKSKKENLASICQIQWYIMFIIAVIFLFSCFLSFCRSENVKQNTDSSILTLERLFNSNEFVSERLGPARWLIDGSGYLILEDSRSEDEVKEIVRYDAETGDRKVIVSSAQLILPGKAEVLQIDSYKLSPDGKRLLIFTNTRRVFHKTFGDFWIFELDSGSLKKLGGSAKPRALTLATFSPDGHKIAYVHKNNIYIEDLVSHTIIQLTSDGSDEIFNGAFDYAYEEEFFIVNGFRWSPNSKLIAYWQLDSSKVPTFYMINNTDSLYPRLIPIKFPKPGEQNSSCRIGVVRAEGGKTLWLKVPGNPNRFYLPQMDWAANSQEVIFQHLNRLQNRNEVMLGDARTGQVRTIMKDIDEAWVHVVPDLYWLDDGRKFLWVSERDGWRHVYLVERTGKEIKLITPGEFDVESIESVDEKEGWLYYISSPDNPTQRYLYRVPLDGSGKSKRLSSADQRGTHSYRISPDSRWAFHTYSTFDSPPVIKLIRLPSHEEVKILADNAKLQRKIQRLRRGPSEFFRVDIGEGVMLDAWSMKPFDFDPNNKYPVLFYVYGEPWGSTVRDQWGRNRYLWHLMLTQQGYIVMSVDNRGTRVPRGRAWRKIIYWQVGILASEDQAAATRAIIKRWDYIDPVRIGIWGRSGGGAMTLNAMFRYPDLYCTGMSVAPVTNQRFYNSIYQERYMGMPDDNAEGYKKGSPITFAHQLKGSLLLVHGTGDDNVHYQNAEALINALIKHNKHFTMMAYPNRSHGIREGENTTRHLYQLLTRFLKENLPSGPIHR